MSLAHARNDRRTARRRSALRVLLVSPLTLALLGVAPVLSPAAPAQAALGNSYLQVFTPANESSSGSRTREQAVNDARSFNVIVATQNKYDSYVRDMKAANPNLLLMAYMNGTFAQSGQANAYPDSWYVKDRNGKKVRSRGYGNYMMNPSNPAWVDDRVRTCQQLIGATGYDGCMLDMLGTAPTQAGYVTALGINPATRAPWTEAQWQKATTALAARVNAATSNHVWGNGYGSASRYFQAAEGGSKILGQGVDGALTEIWIRTAQQSLSAAPSESAWQTAVNQLVDVGKAGEKTAVLVKMWARGTVAQKDAVHRFSLATFLLGTNGKSSFWASYAPGDSLAGHRYWKTAIGTATGAYTRQGGLAQRLFTNGRVVVNPTGSPVTVKLDSGTYRDLSGAVKKGSFVLPAHAGDVLVRG